MNAGHPDTDTLADYAEELLAPDAAAVLEAHVSSCPDCTATLAALAELSDLLADQPVPWMPEDVARRIDDALAQEAAQEAVQQPAEETEAASEPPLRPLPSARQAPRPHRTRRIITRSLVGLAAAAVIGLTGQALVHSSGSSESSGSASVRSGAAATARVFTRSSLAAEANSLLASHTSSGSTSTHPQALTGGQGSPARSTSPRVR
ncbi:zf-HC2 domain-containing protein [Streptacidiphilus monticola]